MKNDEFTLTQGLGQQLEFAFRRNGWDAGQVHKLCEGDRLSLIRQFMLQPNEPPSDLKGTLEQNPLFVPWKTITIGKRKSVDELIQTLKDDDYDLSEAAENILRDPGNVLATSVTEIKLAKLTLRYFGLYQYLHYSIMCRRIRKMGFQLCTPEMAAELRLEFDDQEDMVIVMSMEAVGGNVLDQDLDDYEGRLSLSTYEASELGGYTPGCVEFICVIP